MYVPSSELGLPQPLTPSKCAPPEPKGEGAHSPAAGGLGESQFRRLEKKLNTLPTLWIELTDGDIQLKMGARYLIGELIV